MTAETRGFWSQCKAAAAEVVVIATVYFYFLIFAQFAFLRLNPVSSPGETRVIMTCMGIAGLLACVAVGRYCNWQNARTMLAGGFAVCAFAVKAAFVMKDFGTKCFASVCIGVGTGLLTTSLAAGLPFLFDIRRFGLAAGLGTGLAYAVCNLPAVFAAAPTAQTGAALIASLVGLLSVSALGKRRDEPREPRPCPSALDAPFVGLVAAFFALICLDSAAFILWQKLPANDPFSWGRAEIQGQNCAIHLGAAIVAGLWLDRGGLAKIPMIAFALIAAAIWIMTKRIAGLSPAAHWLYASGVSFYSTALIFAPFGGARNSLRLAARRAGVLFAVSGWIGSGLGIGLAQNLQAIPGWILLLGGAIVVAGVGQRQGARNSSSLD
jgi:cytochrome c oxidase cbb3-type subunit 2